MSLSFLSKKSWHTAKHSNIKNVFMEEEKEKVVIKMSEERQRTIEREAELENLERAIGGEDAVAKHQLSFMYNKPPGGDENDVSLNANANANANNPNSTNNIVDASSAQIQEDDDPATREFRAMLAGEIAASALSTDSTQKLSTTNNAEPVDSNRLMGANDTRSSLEKQVGRGAAVDISLAEQVARFPELKNAPMAAGMHATSVQVKFAPLGKQFRQVKCIKCGLWGHSKGDRDCKDKGGFDPFSMSTDRLYSRDVSAGEVGMRGEEGVEGSGAGLSPYGPGTIGLSGISSSNSNNNSNSDNDSDSSSRSSSRKKKKKRKKKGKEKKAHKAHKKTKKTKHRH